MKPASAETGDLVPLLDALGGTGPPILFLMGSAVWILTTYVGPLTVGIHGAACGGRGWVSATYYAAVQIPIYWVYAEVWRIEYSADGESVNMLRAFAFQFAQPLLWFR